MATTLKVQLQAMKAEEVITDFLRSNGPQRAFIIGLKCMPKENKEGTHKQWAYKHLNNLLERNLITSYRNNNDEIVYRLKECLQ